MAISRCVASDAKDWIILYNGYDSVSQCANVNFATDLELYNYVKELLNV